MLIITILTKLNAQCLLLGSLLALKVSCPQCGSRPFTEFWISGEVEPVPPEPESIEENFERVWLRTNTRGVQLERWFHHAGCRRWITLERDIRNNKIVRLLEGPPA